MCSRYFLILTGLFFGIASLAAAQNAKTLSLGESIQLSLENNKRLKLNRAKIEEADAIVRQSKNNKLPDIKISGSYLRMHSPDIALKEAGGNPFSSLKISQVAYGIGSASLPLFSGFTLRYGIESSRCLAEAARLDSENDREAVIQNTISAYSNIIMAQQTVIIIRENLNHEQERVKDFTSKVKNSTLVRNDLLKAQLQESNVALSLLDAENNLKMAILNMNLMLGLPENTELVQDTTGLQNLSAPGDIETWEQTAIQNRKDIGALVFRMNAASASAKSAKGEYYPSLALTGSYIAADVPGLLTVTNAFGIGLGLKYNFGNIWKTEAKVNQANARRQQILVNEDILKDEIRIQLNQAYEDYVLDLKKIEVYAKAEEQASENYAITRTLYENKTGTTTDLLGADIDQLQAKLNSSFAKTNAMIAYNKLLQAAGVLTSSQPTK